MDLNYLLNREHHSLYMAANSLSASARHAHLAFAKAYGALIAATPFPRREFVEDIGWLPRDSDKGEEVKWIVDCKNEVGRLKLGSELPAKVGALAVSVQAKNRRCVMISSRIPYIGRAHLDKAIEEGRSAAADVARSESDCPYRSHDKPMIRHAWLRGFRAIRRNVSIAGVSS